MLFVGIVVIGLIVWLVNTYLPISPSFKDIINKLAIIAVVIVVILWVLGVLGVSLPFDIKLI